MDIIGHQLSTEHRDSDARVQFEIRYSFCSLDVVELVTQLQAHTGMRFLAARNLVLVLATTRILVALASAVSSSFPVSTSITSGVPLKDAREWEQASRICQIWRLLPSTTSEMMIRRAGRSDGSTLDLF